MEQNWDTLTHNERVELFLDTYRRIETLGEKKLGRGARGSVLLNLARQKKFQKYATELDCCREVRNLLSHEVKVNGEYPAVPSKGMQQLLDMVLQELHDPETVFKRMTPRDRLVEVTPNQTLKAVMDNMRLNDLSFLPMLERGHVRGIFSSATVFLAAMNGVVLTPETKIRDLQEFLPPERTPGHKFPFVRKDMPVEEAAALFDQGKRKNKVRMLLVTQHGRPEEKLLGVISPYDLLN